MDKELQDLLNNARASGANESQMQGIVDAYNQKKKNSLSTGGGSQIAVADQLLSKLSVGSNGQLQQSVPTTSQSFVSSPSDAFAGLPKKETVVTNDGVQFPVTEVVANNLVNTKNTVFDVKALQNRVASKTVTDEDILALSKSSGKSVQATKAYIEGGQLVGGSVENIENVTNNKNKIVNYIDNFNTIYDTKYDPKDVLSSSQKMFDFLEIAKNKKAVPAVQATQNQIISESTRMPAQKEAIPTLLPGDISDEMVNQIVSMTIDEDKKAGVNKDQTVIKIAKLQDPKGFARINDAKISPLTQGSNLPAAIGQLFRDNTSEDELLNTQKGFAELAYNQSLKQNSINKISEGVLSGNQQMITDGQHDLSQVDENVADKYPSLQKQEMVRRVNEVLAHEAGVLQGDETTALGTNLTEFGEGLNKAAMSMIGVAPHDRERVMRELGYLDNPKTKDVALSLLANPSLFADNSAFGSTVQSFLQPFKDLGMSVADIAGIRDSKDIYADKIRDELFPKDFTANVNNPDAPQLKTSVRLARTVLNTTANLAGMLAISTATEGLATGLGASASAAQKLGAYASFGLPAFDPSLKDSNNFIDSEPTRYIYAAINSIANAEGGRLLDLGKVTRFPGLSEDFATLAKGLSDNSITESAAKELLDGAKNKYVDFAVKYGKNVTKGAATMAYFTTANNIIKLGFGDPSIEAVDILPQAGHAFLDGVLGMSILGGFGAVADMRNEKNTTYKGTIYNLAVNHDAAKDVFDIGFKNGEYDQSEYDNKVAILNTAVAAKSAMDAAQSETGVDLTQDQKAVYVANKTAENVLRDKAKNTQLPELKAKYEKQAENLAAQSTQTLDGLKFTPTLIPLYDLYNAEKEYNAALENYKPEDIASGNDLESAKNNYDKLYSDYLRDNSEPSTKLSEPITGLDGQRVPIKPTEFTSVADNQILPTLEKVKQVVSEEKLVATQDILTRVNNAENINVNDIEAAQNELYSALDAAPEAAHLIEPLILKLQDYEFKTKTESSTVTQEVATEVHRPIVERKAVNKSISQWEGNRATITDANGNTTEGVIGSENGNYYLKNENGEKVAVLGEKAITDRDITLPSTETVPNPIQFDENGDVKSMTLQLNKVNKEHGGVVQDKLITINFRDKEKALDYAIQLRAEQVGDFPQPEFDVIYEQIQKEISKEVPLNNANEGVTGTTNEPIPTETKQPEGQGGAGAIQPSTDGTNAGATATTATIPDAITRAKDLGSGTLPPENDNISPVGEVKDGIGITHAQTNEIASELGFPEYEAKPETVAEWDAEAERRIKEDKNTIPKLLEKMQKGDIPDKIEQRVIAKYVATLKAEIEKNPANEKIAELRNVIDLSNIAGGREAGKTLVARKGIHDINDSLAGYFMTEMDANLNSPLTEAQKENVKKEYADITKKEKNYQEKISKLEAENARLKAEQEVKKNKPASKTSTTKKTHEDFVKERKANIDSIREKLKKARGQTNIAILPYANELIAIAPDVLKLVKSYVEEGVTNLGEIIRNVHPLLKEDIPDITEKDVHDIIAGEYNKKQRTKSEAAKDLVEVKMQAQLINKLQRLLDGTEPKNEKAKIKRNQEIEALQKQIKDFKKENPDKASQLKTLKTKAENELKKVQAELDAGKFAEPIKKTPLLYDSELKKEFPELHKQAVEAQNKLIKAKQERQIRLAVQQYENRSKFDKAKDQFARYLNVPRTLMASMDYSAPLRQAVVVSAAHPIMAVKAAKEMFKASFSQAKFDRWSYDLKETPRYQLMQDSGLSLTDPHSLHLQAQEEAFMGNIAEKIPVAGALIKGSERAYVSYLNKMRADLFNRYADVFEENGRTFENSPKLYKGLASYINNSTGRGNLGFAETAAPILNSFLFSPRLIASRFNMLGLGDIATLGNGFYGKLPKEIRVLAMKDMAKFIAAGIGVLSLAALGGAQVEKDPRSSDFGKIKSGDTRWDIWGGFQPYVRVLAQVIAGERKSTNTGKMIDISSDKAKFGASRADPLVSFGRGKLAPVPGLAWDLLSGRTVQGNKVLMQWRGKTKGNDITLKDEAIQHFVPLIYSDVSQAVKDKGVSSLFTVGVPSTFGVGVQTYSKPKK